MPKTIDRLNSALKERYAIEHKIGAGGMAMVYLAEDLKHHRKVAVKVMRPEITASLGSDRFIQEIHIVARLNHPSILALYDSGQADGFLYFVMPHIEGESLRSKLDREKQLPVDEAIAITGRVAAATDYAHQEGVIHRDIKPENILIHRGEPLVADFGIARAVSEAGGDALTGTGVVIGTPGYMSPEQATAEEELDGRSDQYSLACVLHEMLVGEMVFTGASTRAIIAKHVSAIPTGVRMLRPSVPEGVERALLRALDKVPVDRFATTQEFATALKHGLKPSSVPPDITQPKSPGAKTRTPRVVALLVMTALVGVALSIAFWGGRGQPGFLGRPESIVVLPFHIPTTSETERSLVDQLTVDITRELNNWESIRAVPRVSLSGPMFDLGLPGPTLERISDGISVAREVQAQALAAVTLSLRNDSAYLEVTLFDAQLARSVGRPFQTAGDTSELGVLVAAVTYEILGLEGISVESGNLRRRTTNPDALVADVEGMRQLERWSLEDAEKNFRRAIELDTTFAVAHNHLAQTLYWQASENPRRLTQLGPEISQLSTAAMGRSSGLTVRDSMHIRGFYHFQIGDYEEARRVYRTIVSADPSDVYGWLMLGSVEYRDRWLSVLADGSLAPRSNLNVAVQAFTQTLRLQPTFDLGYGHLFDIQRSVARTAHTGQCPAFEEPRDELLRPWENTPLQPRSFCPVIPVMTDSIAWLSRATFDAADRLVFVDGADRLFDRSFRILERWAEYAPQEVRPRQELITALLRQRSRSDVSPPERLAGLAEQARIIASETLALQTGPAPMDLYRFANLHLAVGKVDEAVSILNQALSLSGPDGSGAPPAFAANAFLASGQPERVLRMVFSTPISSWFVPDTGNNDLISYGGAEPVIFRLRLLGAAGANEARLARELSELTRLWSAPEYTEQDREILRADAALRIAVPLASNPAALDAYADVDSDHPLWQALLAKDLDSATAVEYIARSATVETPRMSEAARSFLAGEVASRSGLHGIAAALFTRLDSLPLGVDVLDVDWGLRGLSLFRRAEAYEAIGDTVRALTNYDKIVALWRHADSLTLPIVQEAGRRMASLRSDR